MSECYVYNKDDTLTQDEIDELTEKELKKYNSKIKQFDIFQRFDDGYFNGVTDINESFIVIKFPGVPNEDVDPFLVSDEEVIDNDLTETYERELLRVRRWQIQKNKLSKDVQDALDAGERIVEETDPSIIADFSTIMKDKKV